MNVSLDDDYDGGELYFGPLKGNPDCQPNFVEYNHRKGQGVLHRGLHMHGAMPITTGERTNLIIWMRSSQVRNRICPMCNMTPQLIKAAGFGDGFTQKDINVCDVS